MCMPITAEPKQTIEVYYAYAPQDERLGRELEKHLILFSIGASSADIRAEKTIVLDGQVVEYRQREIVATKVEVV